MKVIPYGKQSITQEDIDAVTAVLTSDYLTQGPVVPIFEKAVAQKVKVKHAVAVNSATSALHIACMAFDLGKGDILWTVPNTFVASANCARYCGADVDFVDIDPDTWNISIEKLKEKLCQAKQQNRLPKVLVPVHFAGQPTDEETIWELSKEYGFKVLEDASHAIGASHNDEPVGSCKWSHITVFSFHPVKIITTGEGGMAVTNDDELAERMAMLRTHGIIRDSALFKNNYEVIEPWYYEQQILGFNYRMTDISASLGVSQLARLDGYVQTRNSLANRYQSALADFPVQLPTVEKGNVSAYHLYLIRIKKNGAHTKTQHEVYNALKEKGILANVHYMPVHLHPYYRDLGFTDGQYPESERYSKDALTLPLYAALTHEQQDHVINTLKNIFKK